jgi:polar amino acid transport system substrate-binding protein
VPTHEQGMARDTLFVLKENSWQYTGSDSLLSVVLGTIKDYAYSDELLLYLESHQNDSARVQIADGEDALHTNIRKLLRGRIDVIPEVESVFFYNAAQLDASNKFKSAGTSGALKPIYITFSPAHKNAQEYARLLAEGTQALRASGKLAEILKTYHLEDWK